MVITSPEVYKLPKGVSITLDVSQVYTVMGGWRGTLLAV
jgi:hypothetical protein